MAHKVLAEAEADLARTPETIEVPDGKDDTGHATYKAVHNPAWDAAVQTPFEQESSTYTNLTEVARGARAAGATTAVLDPPRRSRRPSSRAGR